MLPVASRLRAYSATFYSQGHQQPRGLIMMAPTTAPWNETVLAGSLVLSGMPVALQRCGA